MLGLFAIAIFLAAALLFTVQPLAGKIILPLLGGSPAVWNACMLFFQGALLLGYFYAHVVSKVRSVGTQAVTHGVLLAAALLTLPFPIDVGEPGQASPTWWVVKTLAMTVGPGFVLVSTSGPLLQRWFSRTGHRAAGDPYFLYAASNAGSALGLLAYPFVIEPLATRSEQAGAWRWGYVGLVVLIAACGWMAARSRGKSASVAAGVAAGSASGDTEGNAAGPATGVSSGLASGPTWPRRFLWLCLAAAPSSLMLGVTQYITTDLAAVPLLWIVPLFLYLVTFMLAFAKWRIPASWLGWALLVLVTVIVQMLLLDIEKPSAEWMARTRLDKVMEPYQVVLGLHLLTFFVAALMCHTRLADLRPRTTHLTEYYLIMSLGGVVGGSVNALVAPVLFNQIVEYAVVLGATCLLRPQASRDLFAMPVGIVGVQAPARAVIVRLLFAMVVASAIASLFWMGYAKEQVKPFETAWLNDALKAYLPISLAIGVVVFKGSIRTGLALLLLAAASFLVDAGAGVLHRDRTFFGVHKVSKSVEDSSIEPTLHSFLFSHGTTIHGEQFRQDVPLPSMPDPAYKLRLLYEREGEDTRSLDPERDTFARLIPGSYYHPNGPLGDVAHALMIDGRFREVAFVGLGTGTTAAYLQPGSTFTYYEIDPAVVEIATNPELFTYISDARRGQEGLAKPGTIKFVLGDGRLQLARSEARHDLIVLDAFTSDAIPLHLLTVEALRSYMAKLGPGGFLAVHISNRYFDLEPALAGAATELGVAARIREDDEEGDGQPIDSLDRGWYTSTWVLLAREEEDFDVFLGSRHGDQWVDLRSKPGLRVWTDDYTNVLSALRE